MVGKLVGSDEVGGLVGSDEAGDPVGERDGTPEVGELVGDSVGLCDGSEVVGVRVGAAVVGETVGEELAVGERLRSTRVFCAYVMLRFLSTTGRDDDGQVELANTTPTCNPVSEETFTSLKAE